jgi:SGNH domain (fused to AT3 domains)
MKLSKLALALLALAAAAAALARASFLPDGVFPSTAGGVKRAVGTSVFYNSEHKNLHKQSHRPLTGSALQPLYGLLPSGTEGRVEDHDNVAALVIGDSFVGPLAGVFDDIARARGVKFALTSVPSCAAFFDKTSMDPTIADWPVSHNGNPTVVDCKRVRRREMLELIRHTKPKLAFLAANWVASPQLWSSQNSGGRDDPVTETLQTIAAAGKKLAVFGVVPGAHYNVRACMAGEAAGPGLFGRCPSVSRIAAPFEGEEAEQRRMARRVLARAELARILGSPAAAALGVAFIDPARAMCPAVDKCLVSLHGEPLYSDSMHLTVNGGRLMRRDIEAVLDKHGL